MAAWGYESRAESISLTREFSALEDKICIPAQPCNILYKE